MQDEILAKRFSTDTEIVPYYDLVDKDGNVVQTDVQVVLKNEIVQEGTPLRKSTMLSDATSAALGGVETVDEALARTAHDGVIITATAVFDPTVYGITTQTPLRIVAIGSGAGGSNGGAGEDGDDHSTSHGEDGEAGGNGGGSGSSGSEASTAKGGAPGTGYGAGGGGGAGGKGGAGVLASSVQAHGGAGGAGGAGGGAGKIVIANLFLSDLNPINVTVGVAAAKNTAGKPSKFGDYVTATGGVKNGGEPGEDGSSANIPEHGDGGDGGDGGAGEDGVSPLQLVALAQHLSTMPSDLRNPVTHGGVVAVYW